MKLYSYEGNYTDNPENLLVCKKAWIPIVKEFITYAQDFVTANNRTVSVCVFKDSLYLSTIKRYSAFGEHAAITNENVLKIQDRFIDLTRTLWETETGKTVATDVRYRDFIHNPTVSTIKKLIALYF